MNILITILLFISTTLAYAGTVSVDGHIVEFDDKLSMHNFAGWEFKSRPEYDFSGKTIYATTFTNETPNSDIFAEGTHDVHFVNCHIENIILPPGSTVHNPDCNGEKCWTHPFQVQNDLRDWQIDAQGKPTKVLSEEYWKSKGVSVDPVDIPPQKIQLKETDTVEQILKEKVPAK